MIGHRQRILLPALLPYFLIKEFFWTSKIYLLWKFIAEKHVCVLHTFLFFWSLYILLRVHKESLYFLLLAEFLYQLIVIGALHLRRMALQIYMFFIIFKTYFTYRTIGVSCAWFWLLNVLNINFCSFGGNSIILKHPLFILERFGKLIR